MKYAYKYLYFILSLCFLVSCSNDEDTDPVRIKQQQEFENKYKNSALFKFLEFVRNNPDRFIVSAGYNSIWRNKCIDTKIEDIKTKDIYIIKIDCYACRSMYFYKNKRLEFDNPHPNGVIRDSIVEYNKRVAKHAFLVINQNKKDRNNNNQNLLLESFGIDNPKAEVTHKVGDKQIDINVTQEPGNKRNINVIVNK